MNITEANREKVFNIPLVLPEKIYMPPFAQKAGHQENFVKSMDKTGHGFE